MSEFIETGGNIAIVVIALTLILQALKPFLKKDKSDNSQNKASFSEILTQHDQTNILNELHRMITVQNSHLERIAVAQEAMAEDSQEIKEAINQLPHKMAASLRRERGNGHA